MTPTARFAGARATNSDRGTIEAGLQRTATVSEH